ncbi:MAG: [Firmicutes bacterium]|nr:[FeFe] hydrogenase H-cluster maturation GTPase HydF [Bacillota bacterium]
MGLNNTPRANRLHIGIFGRRNAGKSSLINALTGQDLAIVSDTPGTTADPVFKSMELHPIGPVVFIDTAGFDDEGELGQLRVARTEDIIKRTDIAVLVIDGCVLTPQDLAWRKQLNDMSVPTITVFGKSDTLTEAQRHAAAQDAEDAIFISTKTGEGIDLLRTAIINAVPEEYMQEQLLDGLIEDGSLVLLVMPQDIQAPKGRLILPQVQTIRELLDRRCTVVFTTADGYEAALARLNCQPDLIITDSQCFSQVYEKKPDASALTSFSILMAAAKGDLDVFIDGVSTIDKALHADRNSAAISQARSTFRVLIAEACTHVPLQEDIGTVKIPMILRKQFGDQVEITNVRGNDFPSTDELKQYDLIIHCGACMFNRRHVLSRIAAAQEAGVPITNYGIFLAYAAGILDKITY